MADNNPNAKLEADLDKVIASHNGDSAAAFTKEHWHDLIILYSNRQPAPVDRPLIEPEA